MPSNDYHHHASEEQRKRKIQRIILEIIISVLLIIPAIVVPIYLKEIITKKILAEVKLQPDSTGFKNWLDPPITTSRSYYLFNITNPIDIATDPKSATIKFTDTPPYVYNVKTRKTNVEWSNDNGEINYAVERLFTRHETRFNSSSVNDTGCFVDLLRASSRTQFQNKPTQAFYDTTGYNPFYHRNAVEQLEGFDSDLFQKIREKMIGPNTDMSGLIYRQNGSRLYNVSITTDSMKKGQLLTFASELVRFNILSPSQYQVPVYDGLTYPPMLFDKPKLHIFNSDFCKPVLIQFNKELSMFDGINMHEYKLKLIDYDNCTNPNDTNTCNEVDKVDITKCISDSLPEKTFFLSKAHFYGASNETMNEMNIDGLNQTNGKYDSFIYFEPYSGTPFKVQLRIQVNIDATIDPMRQSDENLDGLKPTNKKGVRRLLPIFWIDQEIHIAERVIKTLRRPILILQYQQRKIVIWSIISAVIIIVIIIVIIEIIAKRLAKTARYSRGTYLKTETTVQY